MTRLIIPDLDEALFRRLQKRAATHGRSVAEEAEALLQMVLPARPPLPLKLGSAIHALFKPLGGVDLALPPRDPMRDAPDFGDTAP